MAKEIVWARRIQKDLRRIQQQDAEKIRKGIEQLAETNRGDIETLTNSDFQYRLRIGQYRVLLDMDADTIWIASIFKRARAYKNKRETCESMIYLPLID